MFNENEAVRKLVHLLVQCQLICLPCTLPILHDLQLHDYAECFALSVPRLPMRNQSSYRESSALYFPVPCPRSVIWFYLMHLLSNAYDLFMLSLLRSLTTKTALNVMRPELQYRRRALPIVFSGEDLRSRITGSLRNGCGVVTCHVAIVFSSDESTNV